MHMNENNITRGKIEREFNRERINSVQRRDYSPNKLKIRRKNPFHDLRDRDVPAAQASLPGDSVSTREVTAEDFQNLICKFPNIKYYMQEVPDEQFHYVVDPKRTPLTEYGCQFGYKPRGRLENKLPEIIEDCEKYKNLPQTTNLFYHRNFFNPQWKTCTNQHIKQPQNHLILF